MKEYRIEYDWAEPHKNAQFQHTFSLGWRAANAEEALKMFLDDWTGKNQVIVTAVKRVGMMQNGESEEDFEKGFIPTENYKKNIVEESREEGE